MLNTVSIGPNTTAGPAVNSVPRMLLRLSSTVRVVSALSAPAGISMRVPARSRSSVVATEKTAASFAFTCCDFT